jgi:hypothetical protein
MQEFVKEVAAPICGAERKLPSVPRSTGCITCVSRKSRCGSSIVPSWNSPTILTPSLHLLHSDGRRPTCKTCEDRKQICRGYRRANFVFLNEGWKAPGVASLNPKARAAPREKPALRRGDRHSSRLKSPPDHTQSSVALHEHASPLQVAKPLTQEPMAVYVCFFLSEFSVTMQPILDQLRRCFSRLINYAPSRTGGEDMECSPIIHSTAALVQGHFGKVKANQQIIHDNYYTYGRALRCMSRKLIQLQHSSFESASEDDRMDMVLSCSMLALWEVCCSIFPIHFVVINRNFVPLTTV